MLSRLHIRLTIMVLLAMTMMPSAMAQTSFYTDKALQQVNVLTSPTPLTAAIPYGSVRVCGLPLTQTQPCLPLATITDVNGNAISNAIGGNFGQLTTDATGRFTFGCTNNVTYQVQVAASASNTPAVNYPITCPGGVGASVSANNTFTGNNVFKCVNNVCYADQFPGATWDIQVAAAVANCPFGDANGSGCIVDARGYAPGSKQSLAASVLIGGLSGSIFKPVQLLIGAYTIQSANGATLKIGPGSSVLCAMPPPGQGYPAMASVFQPVSGFTGDVVRLDPADIGSTQPFTRGSIANCGWDMTNAPTATSLKIRSTTYSQPFHNLSFKGGTSTYIDVGISTNVGAQISETLTFDGIDGQWLGAGPSTSPMIKVTGANEVYLKHIGIFSNLSTFDYNSKGIQVYVPVGGSSVYQVHIESSQIGAFGKCVSIENQGVAQPTTPRWTFVDHDDLEGCYYGIFDQGTSSTNEPQFGTFGPGLRFYTPQSDATHLNPVAVYLDFTDHNVVYGDDSNIQPAQGGSTRIFAQSTANATDNLYFGIRPLDIVLAGTRDFLMGPEWSTNGRFYIGGYATGITSTGTPDDTLSNTLNLTQINYNHGTNFGNCVRDSAAGGKTWCLGPGLGGAASSDLGLYNQTDAILAAKFSNVGAFTLPNVGSSINFGSLLISQTAPTIAAAGCGGSAASIVVANSTASFKINVGTAPTSACTITMPAATTGWNITCNDITTQSTSVFVQKQTGAESTTSVTITNFNDVAVATAFVASDILKCTAAAD